MPTGEEFADLAETKCGLKGTVYQSKYNLTKNESWSAAFVSACAEEYEVSNVLIPESTKCQDIADKGTDNSNVSYAGSWVNKEENKPMAGDIVLFVWSSKKSDRADSVGIVKSYDKSTDSLEVIVGDYGDTGSSRSTVRMVTYRNTYKCIKGYFRPAWEKVY